MNFSRKPKENQRLSTLIKTSISWALFRKKRNTENQRHLYLIDITNKVSMKKLLFSFSASQTPTTVTTHTHTHLWPTALYTFYGTDPNILLHRPAHKHPPSTCILDPSCTTHIEMMSEQRALAMLHRQKSKKRK